ncbi:hypothetical protein IJI86_02495 [Candidatus Saccharibacteria bacterium]|nr:hypothetical protein [Candidatus Saccharibacteria bacterium]
MDLNKINSIVKLFDRRQKILAHNNTCIIEITSFYENVLLNDIIKPFLFNGNYNDHEDIAIYIGNKLNFMDRFKIVSKIAKINNIERFKKFDNFIELRNSVAHNISAMGSFNSLKNEHEISFGGKEILWNEYLEKLEMWSELSHDMAKFIMDTYISLHGAEKPAIFAYCKLEGGCLLVGHNLILPEPEGEYTSFFRNGIDMEMLQWIKEENEYEAQANKAIYPMKNASQSN